MKFHLQVFIYGYSLKSSLVAIVVPDPDTFVNWCASNGEKGTYDDLCCNEKVNKLVLDDMVKVGKSRGLKSFELVSYYGYVLAVICIYI